MGQDIKNFLRSLHVFYLFSTIYKGFIMVMGYSTFYLKDLDWTLGFFLWVPESSRDHVPIPLSPLVEN